MHDNPPPGTKENHLIHTIINCTYETFIARIRAHNRITKWKLLFCQEFYNFVLFILHILVMSHHMLLQPTLWYTQLITQAAWKHLTHTFSWNHNAGFLFLIWMLSVLVLLQTLHRDACRCAPVAVVQVSCFFTPNVWRGRFQANNILKLLFHICLRFVFFICSTVNCINFFRCCTFVGHL